MPTDYHDLDELALTNEQVYCLLRSDLNHADVAEKISETTHLDVPEEFVTRWRTNFLSDLVVVTAEDLQKNTSALLAEIRALYRKYVVFHGDHEEAESGTLALWTLHTHVFSSAEQTPYLLVTAPTSEAGKSKIFDVAKLVVRQPWTAVDPTPAAMFHAIDELHPTVLVDEADELRHYPALQVVLNAGTSPGTPVRRSGKSFDVFCPKAICGIASEKLPISNATLSRCIQIPMRRRAPDEHFSKLHVKQARQATASLRRELFEWSLVARNILAESDPPLPDGLTDRQEDMWMSLFGIAELAGQGWLEDAHRWAAELTKIIPSPPDEGVQILSDVKQVLDIWPDDWVSTRKLARVGGPAAGRPAAKRRPGCPRPRPGRRRPARR